MSQNLDRNRDDARRSVSSAPGRRFVTFSLTAALSVAVMGAAAPAHAVEVAGVSFEQRRQAEGTALELSGAGLLRYRVFIKAYVAALYTAPGVRSEQVLEDVPKRIEIEYFWAIPADALRRVTRERIELGVDTAVFERLAPSVDAMNALYDDIEAGDRLAITYLPGRGTELAHNGRVRGIVPGAEFARALFGVWLGDEPVDEKLRARMLADAR